MTKPDDMLNNFHAFIADAARRRLRRERMTDCADACARVYAAAYDASVSYSKQEDWIDPFDRARTTAETAVHHFLGVLADAFEAAPELAAPEGGGE